MDKIKVLWVIGNLSTGGVETWLKSIYSELSDQGVEIHVLVTNPNNKGEFYPVFEALGVKVFFIPYSSSRILFFTIRLLKLLKTERYKIIHEQGEFAACIKYFLIPNIRNRLFVHIHSSFAGVKEYYFKKRLINPILWKLSYNWFKKSKLILGTSHKSLQDFKLHKRQNARVLYCSVRQEYFREKTFNKNIDILFVGRIDEHKSYLAPNNHKNSWFAINVMIECISKIPSLDCVFIGGPEHRLNDLKEQKLKGIENIKFYSAIQDPSDFFSRSKVFIFPSTHEGLGLVAVEAQLQGCFVLSSDKVPFETKISENITYVPLSSPDIWSMKILELLDSVSDTEIDRIKFSSSESCKNLKKAYESN
jgi:hypothetical protein